MNMVLADVSTAAQQAAEASSTTGSTTQSLTGLEGFLAQYGTIIMLVLLGLVMYFLLIRPQRKRQKEEQKMRNDLRVGDEITTIGGIVGRVLNVKDDVFIIETGADRNKMTLKKWALQSNETVHDTPADDDDDDDDI